MQQPDSWFQRILNAIEEAVHFFMAAMASFVLGVLSIEIFGVPIVWGEEKNSASRAHGDSVVTGGSKEKAAPGNKPS